MIEPQPTTPSAYSLLGRATLALLIGLAWTVTSLTVDWESWRLYEHESVPEASPAPVSTGGWQPQARPYTIVVRGAWHLVDPSKFDAIASRFVSRHVKSAWLQFKQDETDEYLGGEVFYPSSLAPVIPGFEDDRIRKMVTALTSRGIQVFAWQPIFHDPAAAAAHPDWRSVFIDQAGKCEPQDKFLCPGNEQAVAYEAGIAREILKNYPEVSGLYLDFIRYDHDFSCGCPRCLDRVAKQSGESSNVSGTDIRRAAQQESPLWDLWIEDRATQLCQAVETIRDRVEEVRPNCWIGACVLPFSMAGYKVNTYSGQDLERLAAEGIDDLVVMSYWDDWEKSPQWVAEGLRRAGRLVDGECQLTCILDGDMGVRRTRLTLQPLYDFPGPIAFFNYLEWDDARFNVLDRALDRLQEEGNLRTPDQLDLVIRIDTEPDSTGSYDAVNPQMIRTLLDLFATLQIRATFVTCGKLAELQTDVLLEAQAAGHEIACHAYDHEQLDSLSPDDERRVIDLAIQSMRQKGLTISGFAAPRNSISDAGLDRVMEWGLEYEGSQAYDPLISVMDPSYSMHSNSKARVIRIPFIIPNDWDGRQELRMTASQMLEAWKSRLVRVLEQGESVFVLDIHQWSITRPDDLRALRSFIEFASRSHRIRFRTLREAAQDAKTLLDHEEFAIPAVVKEPQQ